MCTAIGILVVANVNIFMGGQKLTMKNIFFSVSSIVLVTPYMFLWHLICSCDTLYVLVTPYMSHTVYGRKLKF